MSRPKGKRGKVSTVESHPNYAEIELALANEISVNKIAEKYTLSRDSLYRYLRSMPPERKALLRYRRDPSPIDLDQLRQSESEMAVQRNVVMLSELYHAWRLAIGNEDFRNAASLAGQHYKYAELQAKLVGELIQGDRHIHLSVTDSPQYRQLVAIVMAWAADKPDLSADLARFLQKNDPDQFGPPMLDASGDGGSYVA